MAMDVFLGLWMTLMTDGLLTIVVVWWFEIMDDFDDGRTAYYCCNLVIWEIMIDFDDGPTAHCCLML